jgi:site-specific DNA-methyltransferase (adenine-specific)
MEKREFGDSAVIYHGDCFDILPELSVTADSIISDIPYGVTACEWDIAPPLDQMWSLFEAKSKENANFVLFACGGFAVDLINSRRKNFRYDLVFAKSNRTGFLNASLQPLRAHENIFVFGRPGFMNVATYNAVKTSGSGRPRVSRAKARKAGGVYPASHEGHTTISDGSTNPISVLAFDRDNNLPDWCAHPTQKPMRLLGYLTMMYTNVGDVILDPFMGSGTTGEAALLLNRRFIGIEKNREFFDISCRRLEEIHQRKTARRLTYITLPTNQPNIDQTTPDAESAIPPAQEPEHQNSEDTNLTENQSCHAECTEQAQ